jgi:CheY-like chemotaxis protein
MKPLTGGAGDSAPLPFTRRSRYILVAEGNTNDLFTTAMLLHRFNYPVCTARNARQALDMVSVAMPSLVITDAVLPGMSGFELLRVLGSNSHTFSIPVILLLPPSGGAGLEREDVEIGGALILQKPVAVEDLYRFVQAAMEPKPRMNIRVEIALPVAVNKSALNSSRGECATNLSAQGMFIRTFKYHRSGESLALQFMIEDRTVNADASIVYTRRQDQRTLAVPGVAVRFTRITGEDRELIERFVHDEVTRGIVAGRTAA